MATRREISDRMRILLAEIRGEIEGLTYDPTALTQGRSSSGTVIRTRAGSLVGQVADQTAVTMIIEAPRWLKILVGYIEQLERDAYAARAERRRFRLVSQALHDAQHAGISTPTGRRHIDLALDRLNSSDD